MDGIRVLCVDPDTAARTGTVEHLSEGLDDLAPAVSTATSVVEARAALGDGEIDCLVTEYQLPDGTGFDLVAAVREASPDAGCILFTDADPESMAPGALEDTVAEYLDKDAAHAREHLADFVRVTVTQRRQASYPVPQNERERIAALRGYDLDSPALRRSLERVTDLAGEHFGVPMASVNIIDEHSQEFLACHGGAEGWESSDREDSICTFTILEDDGLMTVEDVAGDPRFDSVEALDRMGIGAYMGAVVTTGGGLEIGTLCVYDETPRSFSAADGEYLRTLADLAADLIEAHARAGPEDDAETGAERRTENEEGTDPEGER